MVKVKIEAEYTCEICKSEYRDLNDAIECEARGIPKPKLMKGTIAQYSEDILVLPMKIDELEGHDVYWDCYWFRDNGHGDSTDSVVATQAESSILYCLKNKINKDMPAFERIQKFCEENDIKPIIMEKVSA